MRSPALALILALLVPALAAAAAGLTAAVVALRGAEVRLLIVEAAECDDATLRQLLRGIAGIADELTAALVMTCHRPAQIPAGWSAQTPRGERLEWAAA